MKHSARLGSKKNLSDPRKVREDPVEEAINREGEPEFGKGFCSLCVHVYARNQGLYYCLEPIDHFTYYCLGSTKGAQRGS